MNDIPRPLLLLVFFSVVALPSSALEIQADIPTGPGGFSDLEQGVIEAAIEWWEMTIKTDIVLRVNFRKVNLPGNTRGSTSGFNADAGGTPTSCRIDIDTTGAASGWFVDPTPHEDEEFEEGETPFHKRARPGSAAEGRGDMLSVVKHELGHALGFSANYNNMAGRLEPNPDGTRQFAGEEFTSTLIGPSTHLSMDERDHPHDMMNTTVGNGQRRVQSDLVRKMLRDAFGYEVNLGAHGEAQPRRAASARSTMGLALLGVLGLVPLGLRGRRPHRRGSGRPRGVGRLVAGALVTVLVGGTACLQRRKAEVVITEVTTFSEVRREVIRLRASDRGLAWSKVTEFHEDMPTTRIEGTSRGVPASHDALWDALRAMGAMSLTDAEPDIPVEDASTFEYELVADGESHSFTAYSINMLDDDRYLRVYELVSATFDLVSGGTSP